MFHDIQNGIEHSKVVVSDITSVDRETIRYTLVLHLADLHHTTILTYFDPFDNILSEHDLTGILLYESWIYNLNATVGGERR